MAHTIQVPYVNFPAQFASLREPTLAAVERVFAKGDFIMGSAVEEFERGFAEICGVRHAVGVANGTDSLIMSLKVFGIGPGDEVITASNSWISSASSIALIGARPVFADVGPDQNIDVDSIRKVISTKTKAIIPVHLTGRCANMPAIMALAEEHGLKVIEDAAQAVGAKIDGVKAGAWGHLASFSLHPLKNLNAAGDAGIITTNDDQLAGVLRKMRQHGMKDRDHIDFWGYNSRLDTLQAAILLTRLPHLQEWIELRRRFAQRYVAGLSDLTTGPQPRLTCPVERDSEYHTYHVFVIQCDQRDDLQKFLQARGIDTKIHYPVPIHMQKAAVELGYKPGSLPVTEAQAKRILSLPIHQYLSMEQVDYVIDNIREFYH